MKYPDKIGHEFSFENKASKPNYKKGRITQAKIKKKASEITLVWSIDETCLPQFSYCVEIFDNANYSGEPLITASKVNPDVRSVTMDLKSSKNKLLYLRLKMTDIFAQPANEVRKVIQRN